MAIFTDGLVLDRYAFGLGAYVSALLVARLARQEHRGSSLSRRLGGGSLIAWGLLAVVLVDAAATRDSAKWQLAEGVAGRGYAKAVIDGGYEWFGLYQPGQIRPYHRDPSADAWWQVLFDDPKTCVAISFAADSGDVAMSGPRVGSISATAIVGVRYEFAAMREGDPC